MIQRIQSVYLLLGALAVAAMYFFREVWQEVAGVPGWLDPALLVLIAATSLTTLVAIFLYANRERQRSVVLGAQILTVVLMVTLFGGFYLAEALRFATSTGQIVTNRVVVFLLPVVGYVFMYLARRAIANDIKLVRSMDRLR